MIIDALIWLLIAPLEFAVSGLPDAGSLGLGSASGLLVGFAQFNTFLPLAEVVAGIGIVLLVEGGAFAFRVLTWAWQQVPFT